MLENVREDLVYILEKYIDSMVECHINAWYERYQFKSVEDIEFDLYVNHDVSLEIELVEKKLDRDLEDGEFEIIKEFFNESVLDVFREGYVEDILYNRGGFHGGWSN